MTDSHETNHAAASGHRHADGVRSEGLSNEQALRKWALQTILLSPHPMPSSWADLEQASNRYVLFVLTGSSIRPKIGSVINASFGGRRVQAGNENVSTFKGFQNLGLRTLQFGNAAFQFFRSRLHKNSSFHGLGKHMMDEAGRGDNAAARTSK